ncbi:MAG: hypothetical protein ACTSO9_00060 [Candidatus Helarchaeota archaeon]
MTDDLIKELQTYIKEENYVKIFIILKKIFKQLLDMPSYNQFVSDFINFFYFNIEKIIEKEYRKKSQMRQFIQKSLSETISSDLDIQNLQKDEFLKEKIVELISKNLYIFIEMLFDPSVEDISFQNILINLILELFDRFPQSAPTYFNQIFSDMLRTQIYNKAKLNIFLILDKMMDISPKVTLEIIFTWVNAEHNKKKLFKRENIILIENIFQLFKTYCEIYPDYFAPYLSKAIDIIFEELPLLLMNDKNHKIINSFSFIIFYFANHGEINLVKYTKEIIKLSFISKGETQRYFFLAIYHLFENYIDQIVIDIADNNLFQKLPNDILNLIKEVSETQTQDVLIDIFFLLKIELKKIELLKNENNAISIENNAKSRNPKIIYMLLEEYLNILKKIKPVIMNNQYLLLKAITEIDSLSNQLEGKNNLQILKENQSIKNRFYEKIIISKFKKDLNIENIFAEFIEFLTNLIKETKIRIMNQRK